jgi:crossover junction endodeoxyribonuclease RuvC
VLEASDGVVRAVAWGAVRLPARQEFVARLAAVKDGLDEVVLRYRPTGAAVEDVFRAANTRSALRLGEVRGAVLVALGEAGLPVHAYTPAAVKKAVSGYGAAGKDQVGRMVEQLLRLGEVPSPADAADALAVALCHVHTAGLATAGTPSSRRGGYRRPPRG